MHGGGCACMGRGCIWELTALLFNFAVSLNKTALKKNKVY